MERSSPIIKGNRFITLSERRSVNRLYLAAYTSICLALALVVLLGVWGAFRDGQAAREMALQNEIATMRSHAVRTVGRIERGLEQEPPPPKLDSVRDDPWIRQFWLRVIPREDQRLYAAIVDARGTVLMHSDSQLEGQRLTQEAFDPVRNDLAADVFERRSRALAGGRHAYDVREPIDVSGQIIGHYHAGIDVDWLEDHTATAREQILKRWAIVIGGISVVVLLAGASLYYIAYRSAAMRNVADMVQLQRVTELGQVAAGLAHEIRNPLHAIRLNLHSLGRLHNGQGTSSGEEIATIISQSNDEIARLDRLVEELLGFAKPDEAREEDIDLACRIAGDTQLCELRRWRATMWRSARSIVRIQRLSTWIRLDSGKSC